MKRKKLIISKDLFLKQYKVIPEGFVIDHRNECKIDNRLENLQLLTHSQNIQKSCNKKIICINLNTNEKKIYNSIEKASIKLEMDASNISKICRKVKNHKTATSKKNNQKYTFEFLNTV